MLLMRLAVYLCLRFEILMVMYYETGDMVVEICYMLLRYLWYCFSAASFYENQVMHVLRKWWRSI